MKDCCGVRQFRHAVSESEPSLNLFSKVTVTQESEPSSVSASKHCMLQLEKNQVR